MGKLNDSNAKRDKRRREGGNKRRRRRRRRGEEALIRKEFSGLYTYIQKKCA